MTRSTHALTLNGRISIELWAPGLSPDEFLRQRLRALDGVARYSLSVWRLPDGVPFDMVDIAKKSPVYIQAAGNASRLTVEVRVLSGAAALQQVVGRAAPGRPAGAVPTEIVPWSTFEQHVFENEIFDADEAADLFTAYMLADAPLPTWSLRTLAL